MKEKKEEGFKKQMKAGKSHGFGKMEHGKMAKMGHHKGGMAKGLEGPHK